MFACIAVAHGSAGSETGEGGCAALPTATFWHGSTVAGTWPALLKPALHWVGSRSGPYAHQDGAERATGGPWVLPHVHGF